MTIYYEIYYNRIVDLCVSNLLLSYYTLQTLFLTGFVLLFSLLSFKKLMRYIKNKKIIKKKTTKKQQQKKNILNINSHINLCAYVHSIYNNTMQSIASVIEISIML